MRPPHTFTRQAVARMSTLTGFRLDRITRARQHGAVRLWRVLIGVLMVAGLVSSSLAPCLAASDDGSKAQMACCTAGHRTCGSDGTAAECCKTAPRVDALATPLKAASIDGAPTASTIAVVTPFATSSFSTVLGVPIFNSSPPASTRRSHLKLSILRV